MRAGLHVERARRSLRRARKRKHYQPRRLIWHDFVPALLLGQLERLTKIAVWPLADSIEIEILPAAAVRAWRFHSDSAHTPRLSSRQG